MSASSVLSASPCLPGCSLLTANPSPRDFCRKHSASECTDPYGCQTVHPHLCLLHQANSSDAINIPSALHAPCSSTSAFYTDQSLLQTCGSHAWKCLTGSLLGDDLRLWSRAGFYVTGDWFPYPGPISEHFQKRLVALLRGQQKQTFCEEYTHAFISLQKEMRPEISSRR